MATTIVEYKVHPGTSGTSPPSSVAFLEALRKMNLSKREIQCLRAHLSAPGRTLSMTDMGGNVFGQASPAPANRRYGGLGKNLAKTMGIQLHNDVPGLAMIGMFSGKDAGRRSPLTMHESLANALGVLGITPFTADESGKAIGTELPIHGSRTSSARAEFEKEVTYAEGSTLPEKLIRNINHDLGQTSAVEGMTVEQWAKVRLRAAWLANKFARKRRADGTLHCDECNFDPVTRLAGTSANARSVLDVHHMNPLEEGRRITTIDDFALLCPTCHRIEHLLLKT